MGRGGIYLSRAGVDELNYGFIESVIHWFEISVGTIQFLDSTTSKIVNVSRNSDPYPPFVDDPNDLPDEDPLDWLDPIIIPLNPDSWILPPVDGAGELPPNDQWIAELAPYLSEFVDLAGVYGDSLTFYENSSGELLFPLNDLTEQAVMDLVAAGNWSVKGANLVFRGGIGQIPEPRSIGLALSVAAVAALLARFAKPCPVRV
jgi:hypothetical protein